MLAPRPPPPPPPPPGWYPDWQRRVDRLKAAGLPVVVQGLQVAPNGFLALQLQADDAVLPRSNRDRGFPLHISIGMLHHYPPEAIKTARRFAARWQGRRFEAIDPVLPVRVPAWRRRGVEAEAWAPACALLRSLGRT